MKGLLKKGSIVVMVLVVFSILLAPVSMVQAGKEDIPRTFSVQPGIPSPDMFIN